MKFIDSSGVMVVFLMLNAGNVYSASVKPIVTDPSGMIADYVKNCGGRPTIRVIDYEYKDNPKQVKFLMQFDRLYVHEGASYVRKSCPSKTDLLNNPNDTECTVTQSVVLRNDESARLEKGVGFDQSSFKGEFDTWNNYLLEVKFEVSKKGDFVPVVDVRAQYLKHREWKYFVYRSTQFACP